VFGVVSDDVTAVDIVIGKDVFSATMVRNGYYWTAPNASLDVGRASVRAHLKDGSVAYG
jgi:hypothetical protein